MPKARGAWRLAPWPSTALATYLTSLAAVGLPPLPGLKLTPMGQTADGFLKLRI